LAWETRRIAFPLAQARGQRAIAEAVDLLEEGAVGAAGEARGAFVDQAERQQRWRLELRREFRFPRGAALSGKASDPLAPGACCAGAVSERAAAWGAGAACAVQPAVNSRMSPDFIDR